MAENGVDSAHFRFVHNTAEVPVMESYETSFPWLADALQPEVRHPPRRDRGGASTRFHRARPSRRRFSGIVDTVSLAVTTPITAEQCITRFNFRFKSMGDEQ
jgi:hypothetical protein